MFKARGLICGQNNEICFGSSVVSGLAWSESPGSALENHIQGLSPLEAQAWPMPRAQARVLRFEDVVIVVPRLG